MKALAVGQIGDCTVLAELVAYLGGERLELARGSPVDAHRALKLALVGQEGRDLRLHEIGDVLDVVRFVGLPQQEGRRAMRRETLIGVEVGIARGDDGAGDDEPRRAVVGMEAVPAPGVVGQHDLGTDEAQQPGDLPPGACVVAELTIGPTEEGDVAPAEKGGGAALLLLAHGDEHRLVLSGVPTSLRTVGQHEVVQGGARRRPLGQRGAAAELDVIGMGADGQDGHRDKQIA